MVEVVSLILFQTQDKYLKYLQKDKLITLLKYQMTLIE